MCVEIKQRLIDVWSGLQQNVVDTAVNKLRKRLRASVRAQRDTLNIYFRLCTLSGNSVYFLWIKCDS